jgi:hypothetical protein
MPDVTIHHSPVTPAIERLAALDSAPRPAGPLLVASVDGVARAALPLDGGPVIADPFERTDSLVALLRVRAAQLRARPARRRRRYALAAAAVAVLAVAVLAPIADAATPAPGGELYVATAGGGTLTPTAHGRYRLVLRHPSTRITAFSDHPARSSRGESLRSFVAHWSKAGFAADPPNAALVVDHAPADRDVMVLELSKPELTRSGALTFHARRVGATGAGALKAFARRADGKLQRSFGRAGLFIDSGTMATHVVQFSMTVPGRYEVDIAFDKASFDPASQLTSHTDSGATIVTDSGDVTVTAPSTTPVTATFNGRMSIRKAIGARRSDILTQFLTEAVLVSTLGGVTGVLVGIVGSQFTIAGVEPVIAVYSIFLSFGAAMAAGLFVGTYPASRAARLRPIEALRFE